MTDVPNPRLPPGIARYLTLGACALGAIGLVLWDRGFGPYAALPPAAGLAAGLTAFGPIALVGTLAVCLNVLPHEVGSLWRETLSVPDLVLCGGVLGYTAAWYRLQALRRWVLPAEAGARGVRRRAAGLVTQAELSALVIALPVAAVAASLAWAALTGATADEQPVDLPTLWQNPDLPAEVWQLITLTLLVGLAGLVAASAFDYVARRSLTAEQAELLLQDSLWAETRGDQRRVSRWLAWARVRRKEGP